MVSRVDVRLVKGLENFLWKLGALCRQAARAF